MPPIAARVADRMQAVPVVGRLFRPAALRDLKNTRVPAARDAAAVAAGSSLAQAARRLLLVPYRDETVALPEPLVAGDHRFDVVTDLIEFTSLEPQLVRTLLARRIENFRTEWLQAPNELRADGWHYLSSRTYLFANAGHFHEAPESVDEIAAVIPSGARVLDFGGGTGNLALALAARGFRVDYHELSALQKDFVRFRLQRYGLEDRLEILDAWAPLPRGRYDAVCALDVLEHLPDLPSAVRDLADSLVPGGILLDTPTFLVSLANPMHHEDPGLEELLAAQGVTLERTLPGLRIWKKRAEP